MIGIGIDAVELDRFRKALLRQPKLADRLFTADELAYGRAAADATARLAARFAVKEATMKALGVGLGAFSFHDVAVTRDEASGAPALDVTGAAAALAEQRGVRDWRVSITHTEHTAHAVVVAL